MASDTGYSSFFKIGKETTYGTSVTPESDVLILDSTGSIDEEQNVEVHHGTGSRKAVCSTYGNYAVNGSINGKLQGGRLIAYALGKDTVTDSSGLYTHTITPEETLNSFTLDKLHKNIDKGQRVSGCKISDFSINLDVGGQLTSTFNFLGQKVEALSSATAQATKSTNCPLNSYQATINWNSSPIEAKAFSFNYNNTIGSDEYSISSRLRKELPEGGITMDGTFTLVFKDLTVYNDFQTTFSTGAETGTKRDLSFSITNGLSGSNERSYLVSTNNVILNSVSSPIELGEGRIVQEYSYTPTKLTSIVVKDEVSTNYIA